MTGAARLASFSAVLLLQTACFEIHERVVVQRDGTLLCSAELRMDLGEMFDEAEAEGVPRTKVVDQVRVEIEGMAIAMEADANELGSMELEGEWMVVSQPPAPCDFSDDGDVVWRPRLARTGRLLKLDGPASIEPSGADNPITAVLGELMEGGTYVLEVRADRIKRHNGEAIDRQTVRWRRPLGSETPFTPWVQVKTRRR